MRASELKKGHVVTIDGTNYIVKEIQVKSPSSRGANTLYKVRFNNVVTKQKMDETYKGDDVFQAVDFTRRPVQLIYKEVTSCTFMDNEDYTQYTIDNDLIEEELLFLTDGLDSRYFCLCSLGTRSSLPI